MAGTTRYEHHRPIGVTVIVVLMWIQGLLAVAAGLILLIERDDQSVRDQLDWTSSGITGSAIGLIVFGAITVLLAVGLGRGSNVVRFLVGIVSFLHLAGGIYIAIWWDGSARTSGIVQAAIAAAILFILFGSRSSQEYFSQA